MVASTQPVIAPPKLHDYAGFREKHHSDRTLVLSARRVIDGEPVVLKMVAPGCGDPAAARSLRWEYEVLQLVRGAGVPAARRLIETPTGPVVELEDLGDTLADARPLGVDQVLQLGIELANVLTRVHRAGVLHRDIHPKNIVFSKAHARYSLVDFGAAARVEGRIHKSADAGLGGAFGYWAPEQTGRFSRPLDHRTDLFSLGAVLFRQLCGAAPGATDDVLSAVHAALAVVPPPVQTLTPDVPATVSRIVARLLAKVPEDRYQSAAGLASDLTRARDEFRLSRRVSDFPLGSLDVSEVFAPSRRLQGRSNAIAVLGKALAAEGPGPGPPVVTVTGPTGVGKSALVAEGARVLAATGASIAIGRYDEQSSRPLMGIIEALHAAIRLALALPDRELAQVRERACVAVAECGPAFVDMVPKLRLLVPEVPAVPELPPAEARNRTLAGLDALARSLHTPARRLVLFLDDLHWADAPSIELLDRLLLNPEGRPTLILAWRDADDGAGGPLVQAFARLPPETLHAVHLGPLGVAEITELVAETLSCPPTRAAELAGPLTAKSGGNPYFVVQLLESLHERGGLRFDPTARGWTWAESDVALIEVADSVAVLLADRLRGLPAATRQAVAVAARLGQRVRIVLLATALSEPIETIAAVLEPALVAGHLLLSTDGGAVSFAHHRVRQAALATAPEEEIDVAELARRLASHSDGVDVFVVADRCAEAMASPVADRDAIPFAKALARAACAARIVGATGAALGYAEQGVRALGGQEARELWLELHLEGARASVISTDRTPTPDFISVLMASSIDKPSRNRVRALGVDRYIARWENDAALDGTIAALAELGVVVPKDPTLAHVGLALGKTAYGLWRVGDEQLGRLPVATDRDVLAAQDLLLRAVTPAYYCRPNLLSLLIIKSIDLAVTSGVGPPSAWAFATYAFIQAVVLGRLDRGSFFARLARATLKRTDGAHLWTRVELTLLGFIDSREGSLAGVGPRYESFVPRAIADGDWEYAAICANNAVLFGLGGRVPLDELLPTAERMLSTCIGLGHRRQIASARLFAQLADSFVQGLDPAGEVGGRFVTSSELATLCAETADANLSASWHAGATLVHVHFGQYELAAACAERMDPILQSQPGSPQAYWHHTYGAIARALAAGASGGARRRAFVRAARSSRRALVAWVKASPHNHRHRLALVDGALAVAAGKTQQALRHFEEAVHLALQAECPGDAALGAQLAAHALSTGGHTRGASGYLAEAVTLYGRWGAKAVVAQLRPLLGPAEPLAAASTSTRGFLAPEHLGLLRAARAVSEVTGLSPLLETVLRVLVEGVGARRGLLAIPRGGRLVTVASASSRGGEVSIELIPAGRGADPEDLAPGSSSTVVYVARVGEPVRIDEPYSLLAVPLRKGESLLGVVYLDNDALPGAFSAWHQEFATVLAAQAAIALQNAGLIEDLRSSLEMQTRIADSYNRFVPHAQISLLDRSGILEVLPGDQVIAEFTVLFADIRGFTSIAEQLDPSRTFFFINDYLRHVQPAIHRNGGIINQIMGDGIMALFPRDADAAVAGAVAVFAAVREYNNQRDPMLPEVRIGAGLNTGMLALGTLGVPERLDCGVIGDPVNIASRVEGLTKPYGAPLVISDTTYLAMKHPESFAIRELDLVVPVGRKQPLRIFEVVDAEVGDLREAKLATLDRFRAARAALVAGSFEVAREGFLACLVRCPGDLAAMLLAERCARLLDGGTGDWDGAYRPKSK